MLNIIRRMASSSVSNFNRLKFEKSPYLLQHANNPVHWYPWGEEAFQAAKDRNKLIFLSVGYSTCHWCHVMEHESFENENTAKIMNENFINVKVDREERPDIDKIYMSYVVATHGHGGWPMSVWLTPDLKPIYGGTYFPPEDYKFGAQMGFPRLLKSLAKKWEEDKETCENFGKSIAKYIKTQVSPKSRDSLEHEEAIAKCAAQLIQMYEPEYGGFTRAPKFPKASNFNFIFSYRALYANEDAQTIAYMASHTLTMMDRGGIHDHVGQGFARYSVDKKWHVPHFEKMLYDQAQLLNSYLDAYLLLEKEQYAEVARDICTYVMRDLSHPEGGFYSAEDADSLPTLESENKVEGAFCVWTHKEITELLTGNVEDTDVSLCQLFCHHFMVIEDGNVEEDKLGHFPGKNVLMEHDSIDSTADEFKLSVDQVKNAIKSALLRLYEHRQKRPKPHLDDKIVAAWNGMMLSALSRAGAILNDDAYVERALKCGDFIKKYLIQDGSLYRTAYRAENDEITLGSKIEGFSDDYAWSIRSFIELYNTTLDSSWLEEAEKLQDKQIELFWDMDDGGFFMSKENPDLLVRLKESDDGAEPTDNAVSARNLLVLSRLLNRPDFEDRTHKIFATFSEQLNKLPLIMPEMVVALMMSKNPYEQIIISGSEKSPKWRGIVDAIHTTILSPNRVTLVANSDTDSFFMQRHPKLMDYRPKDDSDSVSVFICRNFTCSLPAKTPEQVSKTLKKGFQVEA